MRMLNMGLIVLSTFTCLTLSGISAEAAGGRKEMTKVLKQLNSPYGVERRSGIRELAGMTDKALLQEFKVVERLIKVARRRSLSTRERSEALQALVNFAMTRIISPDELLDHMRKIIRNDKDKLEIRIDALRLLAEFGAVKVDERDLNMKSLIEKLHGIVLEISEDRSKKTPKALRGAAIVALGSISGNAVLDRNLRSEGEDVILSATRDKSGRIRTSAMEALLYYVESTQANDVKLFGRLLSLVTKKSEKSSSEMRLVAIQAMETMLAYEVELSSTKMKDLSKFLNERIRKGSDEELIAASRCFLRIREAKMLESVIGLFTKELTGKKHGKDAQKALLMGLIELLNPLGALMEEKKTTGSTKKNIQKSVEEVTDFLRKLAAAEEAGDDLRILAINGIGAVPMTFSRRDAVKTLIEVLKVEAEKVTDDEEVSPLATEVVRSLVQFSRTKAFKTKDGKINVVAWERWYDRNDKYLAADKAPWMLEDEE